MKRFKFYSFILCMVLCLVMVFMMFSGCNKDEYADPEGKYLKPKKLSAKVIKQIKGDYVSFYNYYTDIVGTLTIDDVSFHYMGTYNDAIAVLPYPDVGGDDISITQNIAGYSYLVRNTSSVIRIYKDGTFTEGNEAYEKGMITKQDAEAITWLYNNEQGLVYKSNKK